MELQLIENSERIDIIDDIDLALSQSDKVSYLQCRTINDLIWDTRNPADDWQTISKMRIPKEIKEMISKYFSSIIRRRGIHVIYSKPKSMLEMMEERCSKPTKFELNKAKYKKQVNQRNKVK